MNLVPVRAAILIVEDDDETATVLEKGLGAAGYVVRRASSGAEAMAALESMQVDLILVSLLLPDTDGLILCAALTAQLAASVIMLSARAGEVDRALALRAGAIGTLTPVDVDELLTHVRAAIVGNAKRPPSGRLARGGRVCRAK